MVTKKELEELQQEYDTLMQEAVALQEVARQRLIVIKALESFFNQVNGAVNRTRIEFNELQAGQVSTEPEERSDA